MPDQTYTPVLERITQNVVDTLSGVTTVAGYGCNLIVERPNPTLGNRTQDNLAVVEQGNPELVTDGVPFTHDQWQQPYAVHCIVTQSETATTPIDTRLNRLWADVVRAITTDITRGTLAQDTVVQAPEFQLDENLMGGRVTCSFYVEYRTLKNDPFTSAYEA